MTPAKKHADKAVGDWAATRFGDTHFSFGILDNLEDFIGAKVVLIGKKDGAISYDLQLSISQNALRHDDFTDSIQDLPALLVRDELLEIDVSEIFPSNLAAGVDYASLHFNARHGRRHPDGDDDEDRRGGSNLVQVIGLRFQYDSVLAGGGEFLAALQQLVENTGCHSPTVLFDRFADCGNGTILDLNTGLFWLKDASCAELPGTNALGRANWQGAKDAAAALGHGACGLTDGSTPGDWRVPEISEWCGSWPGTGGFDLCDATTGLVNHSFSNPALGDAAGMGQWSEGDAFVGAQLGVYWSATVFGARDAWAVALEGGGSVDIDDLDGANFVWPVRGGQ